jgi:hypothetical protein
LTARRGRSERRVEAVADVAVHQVAVPEVVRVVDLEPKGTPVAAKVLAACDEAPDAGDEVPAPEYARRLVGEVRFELEAPVAADRIVCGRDHADARFGQDVLLQAEHAHGRRRCNSVLLACAHDEGAEVRTAGAARRLEPGEDRDLVPLHETDPSAEEGGGGSRRAQPVPNEDVGGVEKKVRFSGKKRGKRVRFVRRASTSVSAKSVLTVIEASAFVASRCVASRLGSRVPSAGSSGEGSLKPPTTDGRTLSPRPRSKRGSPARTPARLVWKTV